MQSHKCWKEPAKHPSDEVVAWPGLSALKSDPIRWDFFPEISTTSFFLPRNPPDRNRRAENSGDFLGVVILENSRVHLHGQAGLFLVPLFH